MNDYGYEIPEYVRELTWEDDYSSDSNSDDVISEIERFIKKNRKACQISKDLVTIELGTDRSSQKTIENWKNILPAEMKAVSQSTRECCKIILDRKELESKLGYKLNTFLIFGRK